MRNSPETHGQPERLAFIEFLRALAALAIVLHHVAFYGPLPEIAREIAPNAIDWLCKYARMAVHAFLVIAGFGAARRVLRLPHPIGLRHVLGELSIRYQRVVVPYLVGLSLALLCNEIAREWMSHPSISARPSVVQLVAHAMLLTDILEFEPLTAGAWYVAIDFQLVGLTTFLAWLAWRWNAGSDFGARAQRSLVTLCSVLGTISLLLLSRRPQSDEWALYFFGSYFLGMVVEFRRQSVVSARFIAVQCAIVVLALAVEFRGRVLVAAVTAALLLWATKKPRIGAWPQLRSVLALGNMSYSLFLVHFPVCLLVNAITSRIWTTPRWAAFGMFVSFVSSIAAAVPFHRFVERRCRGGAPFFSSPRVSAEVVNEARLSTSDA